MRLEKDGRNLVIDPGALTSEPEAVQGVDLILVTHEHFDHVVPEHLVALARQNPQLVVCTCPGVARHLGELGSQLQVVGHGDAFTVAGFHVAVVGEKHHVSHPDAPPVDNVGFLVDGQVFHPGDALTELEVPTLLAPGQAPWMTVPDLIRYLRSTHAECTIAIHDGLLNHWGLQVLDGVLASEAERGGLEIRRLQPGDNITLPA